MTEAQRIRQLDQYKRAEKSLMKGTSKLLDAAKYLEVLWQNGTLTYEEANTALKLLAKVKTP